jgi:ubiquinone/menaquinone biosynthesis C-methylase UbiE
MLGLTRNSVIEGAPFARSFDTLVLDHVLRWGWEEMLFLECGDGWAAEEAWRRRLTRGRVVGLDMSPDAIECARRLRGVTGRVEFATWDGRQLFQHDGEFDQVIARFALQRSPEPAAVAHHLLRVLRPGGELYVVESEAGAGEVRDLLGTAGFAEIEELARADAAAVIHARRTAPPPAPSPR